MDYKFVVNYIRITRCLASFFIPVLAFTLSSSTDIIKLFIVSAIIILSIAATYSYNSLKDVKEDIDNPLHPSPLKKSGIDSIMSRLPFIFFTVALFMSFTFTSIHSFSLFLLSVLSSLIYSYLKIKRFFFIKTIFISLSYMALFLSCYLAFSNYLTSDAILAGILFCILIFTYSIISDMRDIASDNKHKLITIPVKYGYLKSTLLVIFLFFILNFTTTILYLFNFISPKLVILFFMFIPFEIIIAYYLHIQDLGRIEALRSMAFTLITFFMLAFI